MSQDADSVVVEAIDDYLDGRRTGAIEKPSVPLLARMVTRRLGRWGMLNDEKVAG